MTEKEKFWRDTLIVVWAIYGPALIVFIIVVAFMINSTNSRLIRLNEAVQANGEALAANGEALAAILEQLKANGEALEANGEALETMRSNLRERLDEIDALNLETVEINGGAANSERRLSDFEALEQPQ